MSKSESERSEYAVACEGPWYAVYLLTELAHDAVQLEAIRNIPGYGVRHAASSASRGEYADAALIVWCAKGLESAAALEWHERLAIHHTVMMDRQAARDAARAGEL